ncbi:hypothetical protein BE18_28570 [Sorangium cellulosum]|uniref:Uncharacterized protein n=1 Tax=Sorangium cellulosum TaxID=56 RepID=A0A150RQB6_SORCE|nr:hypothetical protein BE18_28570 [Sorangium cellulosum]
MASSRTAAARPAIDTTPMSGVSWSALSRYWGCVRMLVTAKLIWPRPSFSSATIVPPRRLAAVMQCAFVARTEGRTANAVQNPSRPEASMKIPFLERSWRLRPKLAFEGCSVPRRRSISLRRGSSGGRRASSARSWLISSWEERL